MSIITLSNAQTLREEADRLVHTLVLVSLCQARIVKDAIPSKTRWEKEFAELQRVRRILDRALERQARRNAIVYKFFM